MVWAPSSSSGSHGWSRVPLSILIVPLQSSPLPRRETDRLVGSRLKGPFPPLHCFANAWPDRDGRVPFPGCTKRARSKRKRVRPPPERNQRASKGRKAALALCTPAPLEHSRTQIPGGMGAAEYGTPNLGGGRGRRLSVSGRRGQQSATKGQRNLRTLWANRDESEPGDPFPLLVRCKQGEREVSVALWDPLCSFTWCGRRSSSH